MGFERTFYLHRSLRNYVLRSNVVLSMRNNVDGMRAIQAFTKMHVTICLDINVSDRSNRLDIRECVKQAPNQYPSLINIITSL